MKKETKERREEKKKKQNNVGLGKEVNVARDLGWGRVTPSLIFQCEVFGSFAQE